MKKCFIHNTGVLCPGTNCGMGIFLDDATEQTTHVECSECGVCKFYHTILIGQLTLVPCFNCFSIKMKLWIEF